MWTPERVYPLGFPGRQALQLTLGGLGVAFAIGYFRFLASFSSAKNELYTSVRIDGKWVPKLIEGSVIAPFSRLLGGISLGLTLVALCLIISLFLHYAWHKLGSRSIYRMKLLPNRWELWRRVVLIPLVGLAACALLWGLLLLLCALTYHYGTPDGHFPPNCWRLLCLNCIRFVKNTSAPP